MTDNGDTRDKHVTIRIPQKLREAINRFAAANNTTVSQLTLDYYRSLVEQESPQEAEQV